MNGQESVAIASIQSENFEPQTKKVKLENVDGEQPNDFQTHMLSNTLIFPEGNHSNQYVRAEWCGTVLVVSVLAS